MNSTIVSGHMELLPYGRGYRFGKKQTSASVHVEAVMMSQLSQGYLLKQFENTSQNNRPDLYIGVGGTLNLSYIAALKPKAAVLLDINPVQTAFWQQMFSDISKCDAPLAFRKAAARTEENVRSVISAEPLQQTGWMDKWRFRARKKAMLSMHSIFNIQYSFSQWLETDLPDRRWISEEYYVTLHNMVCEGRIGALTLDIADTDGVEQFRDVLDKQDLKADVVHVSNVFSFMTGDNDWVGRNATGGQLAQMSINNIRTLSKEGGVTIIDDDGAMTFERFEARFGHLAL